MRAWRWRGNIESATASLKGGLQVGLHWSQAGFEEAIFRLRSSRVTQLAKRQWRRVALIVLAILSAASSLALRIDEASEEPISDSNLRAARIGIYADVDTVVAWQYRTLSKFATTPTQEWNLDLKPGPTVTGRATYLLLGPGAPYYELNIDKPLTVVVALPAGAEWGSRKSSIMADGLNCASWYDGETVTTSPPIIRKTYDDSVVFVCRVPAVGQIQQLTFDLRFKYPNPIWNSSGIGRVQSGLRLEPGYSPDLGAADLDLNYGLRQPTEVSIDPTGRGIFADAFPEPTGGSADDRSWRVGYEGSGITGDDITYSLEDSRVRALIQPAVDFLLLMAGFLLGLAPSARPAKKP